jgi:hypothetical protein
MRCKRARARWGTWLVVWLGAVLALVACDTPPAVQARLTCETLCKCLEPSVLPSVQERCITECAADSEITQLPDSCLDCIFAHADSCTDLLDACEPACNPPEPPVGFPDAF